MSLSSNDLDDYITFDGNIRGTCKICRDIYGCPIRFDKRNAKHHLVSAEHMRQVAAKSNKGGIKPRETLGGVEVDPDAVFVEMFSYLLQDGNETLPADCLDSPAPSSAKTPEAPATTIGDGPTDYDDMPELESDSDWETDSDAGSDTDVNDHARAASAPAKGPHAYMHNEPDPGLGSGAWFPYKSKAMYLADVMASSRRLNFSRRQMRAALEYARETGGENIPTLEALKKTQKQLKSLIGSSTTRHAVPSGTVYYLNDIAESLKQEIANPSVRPHMSFFPHMDGDRMSQAWNGRKLVYSLDDSFLTPCVSVNDQIFYVGELVRRTNGWFIPLRYILFGPNKELRAFGHVVSESPDGFHVHSGSRTSVHTSTFIESFPELEVRFGRPNFDEVSASFGTRMPHPLRVIAGSRLVYSIPIIIFMDDASGNRSKQWSKHYCCYFSNAALRREALQLEYNVRFVATSPHATPSELMHGVRASIESAFENPIAAYDSVTHQEVLIRPFPLFWAGDNPMQAEHCSSSGLTSSHFCRTCMVGGTDEFKQSDKGYPTLFKSGPKRKASETMHLLDQRLDMTIKPRMILRVKEHTRASGIKDPVTQLWVDHLTQLNKTLHAPGKDGLRRPKDEIEVALKLELQLIRQNSYMNPLLDMPGVDIHRDTPTELLHTILLGVVKYFWAQSVYIIEKNKSLHILESRLASVSVCGLDMGKIPARYVCQFRGSLIGKHFKMLVQSMAFVSYDLVPDSPDVVCAWVVLSRLTSLLWYTEIEDVKAYTKELESIIDDFLLITARCSPSIMVLKPKFHFLVHLPAYIRRFGPALLFSTERFESFNGVFRSASTFSNRQAPSRDIAQRFVQLDQVKHICSGGFWRQGPFWKQASPTLVHFSTTNKVFAPLIGIPKSQLATPGLPRWRASVIPQTWLEFASQLGISQLDAPGSTHAQYYPLVSVVSQSGDVVDVGVDVVYGIESKSFGHVKALFGCVEPNQTHCHFVALQGYCIDAKHTLWDMPVAVRNLELACILTESVECLVNMQHDCIDHGPCTRSKKVYEMQERERTSRIMLEVAHADDTHFVVNLGALHNAQRIRRALPERLFERAALSIDREATMEEAVKVMKQSKELKTTIATAKRDAKAIVTAALNRTTPTSEELAESGSKRKAAGTRLASKSKKPRLE